MDDDLDDSVDARRSPARTRRDAEGADIRLSSNSPARAAGRDRDNRAEPDMARIAETIAKLAQTVDTSAMLGFAGIADTIAKLTQPVDTSAMLGFTGIADTIAKLTQPIDTSAMLGIRSVASAFGDTYGAYERVILADYRRASQQLLDDLEIDDVWVPEELVFSYSADARAYDALSEVAPEVAVAVDRAAQRSRTAFWSQRAVRNSLSWLLVGVILTLFISGTFIPTWGSLLVNALSGSFAALEVRRLSRPDK